MLFIIVAPWDERRVRKFERWSCWRGEAYCQNESQGMPSLADLRDEEVVRKGAYPPAWLS